MSYTDEVYRVTKALKEQMEIAGAAMGDMGINAEIAGAAILGLRDGLYENAEAIHKEFSSGSWRDGK